MHIVHVHIHVKPEFLDDFKSASIKNARSSIHEPGVKRFDFIQEIGDPTRFILIEVYRDDAAQAAHKETEHYIRWRDLVAEMMVEPRTGVKFTNVFPEDSEW